MENSREYRCVKKGKVALKESDRRVIENIVLTLSKEIDSRKRES